MAYITKFNPVILQDVDKLYISQIEQLIMNKESITPEEAEVFLDYACFALRQLLNPEMDNFRNKCDLAQSILYYYFRDLGCKVVPNSTLQTITNDIVGHNFLTLELIVDGQATIYLVDPTYIQFFDEYECSSDRFYVSPMYPDKILLTPDPGYFIDPRQKEIVNYLLDHGHIKMTDEIARVYGDSFFNTKVGVSLSNWKFNSIAGQIYINSFLKTSCHLSKTEEELQESALRLHPFNDLVKK